MVPFGQNNQNNALALSSPRSALKRSAEQAEVEVKSSSSRMLTGEPAKREEMVQIVMPPLSLTQVNVLGNPEAERQVQVLQGQLARMSAGMQNLEHQFQTKAEAFGQGREHDRRIFQEAYEFMAGDWKARAHQYELKCVMFLQEKLEELNRQQEHEQGVFQRLRERELQKTREAEMFANAARNHEATVSLERRQAQLEVQRLQQEAVQQRQYQEKSQADVQQSSKDLAAYQQHCLQLEDRMAKELKREVSEVTERTKAMWHQEHQQEKGRCQQECHQLKCESQGLHGHLTAYGRQEKEIQMRLQQEQIAIQSEAAMLTQQQQVLVSERQDAHLAGLRARQMEMQVQKQLDEVDQQHQREWQLMQEQHAALQKQNESLMNDLITCQGMILEKTPMHPPQQCPVLEQVHPLASAKPPLGLGPEKSGGSGWNISADDTLMGCGSE
jgi:hypothetical protein